MADSQTNQKSSPQIKCKLEPNGQFNYEGELNQESAEILEKLLQQAEYYRSKSKESESEKQQARQQIDSITMHLPSQNDRDVKDFTMKTIQFYTSGQHLDKLCEQFGHELELLDREQKLELRIVLTYLIWGQEQLGSNYSINDAWIDSLQHLLSGDEQIVECLEILQGISVKDGESLLVALQSQCTQGNARLKTPTETMTEDLVNHGVAYELAKHAAYIIHKVDGNRKRSADEQSAIDSVHKILTGVTTKS